MNEWIVRDYSAIDAVRKISESTEDSIDLIGMIELIADCCTPDENDVEIARRIIININNAE